MAFESFSLDSYRAVCKSLLDERGGTQQREFLQSLHTLDSFSAWLAANLVHEAGDSVDILRNILTESSFKDMPAHIELAIYLRLKDEITTREAISEGFWAMITYRHMQSEILSPHCLVVDNDNLSDEITRIDNALAVGDIGIMDDMVRTALRHFGGLHIIRGTRSARVDCVLGRAWWRGYFVEKTCKETPSEFGRMVELFRINQTFWEKLIDFVVFIEKGDNQEDVYLALFWAMSEYPISMWEGMSSNDLVDKLNKLRVRSESQDFRIFDIMQLRNLIATELAA